MKKKKRTRSVEREKKRELDKLGRKLDRLVDESPGGSPERAIAVDSASVVEVKARAIRCVRCEGELTIHAHEADSIYGAQYRRLDMQCSKCLTRRRIWFVLGPGPAN
jgi:hypothetical protein